MKAKEECAEAFEGRTLTCLIEAINHIQMAGFGEVERLLLKRTKATECHAEEPHGPSSVCPALSSTVASSKMSFRFWSCRTLRKSPCSSLQSFPQSPSAKVALVASGSARKSARDPRNSEAASPVIAG